MGLEQALRRIRWDWCWLAPLMVANFAGMAFGWYYYWDVGQFRPGHEDYVTPALWPLVADSPNAVLLFVLAVLGHRLLGKRSKVLDAAAFVLNAYVGLWTTFLFVAYADDMGTFDWGSANSILFVSHMGMPLQALLLLPEMRNDRWTLPAVMGVAAAALAFVWVDYWGPTIHPAPFLHHGNHDVLLHLVSPWIMGFALAAWLALAGPLRNPAKAEGEGKPGAPAQGP